MQYDEVQVYGGRYGVGLQALVVGYFSWLLRFGWDEGSLVYAGAHGRSDLYPRKRVSGWWLSHPAWCGRRYSHVL